MRPGMSEARPGRVTYTASCICPVYLSLRSCTGWSCVSLLSLRLSSLPASFRSPCVSPLSLCLSALLVSLLSPCVSPLSLRLSALPASLRQQNVLFCPLKALSENPNRLYKLFKFSILIMSTYLRTNFTDPVLNIWILFVFEKFWKCHLEF